MYQVISVPVPLCSSVPLCRRFGVPVAPVHRYTTTWMKRYTDISVHRHTIFLFFFRAAPPPKKKKKKWYTGTVVTLYIGTPVQQHTGTPVHRYTRTPIPWYTGTPAHWYTGTSVHSYVDEAILFATRLSMRWCVVQIVEWSSAGVHT